jgi:hypothetical protein
MTRDEMTGDEMTRDEMTGDEITRSQKYKEKCKCFNNISYFIILIFCTNFMHKILVPFIVEECFYAVLHFRIYCLHFCTLENFKIVNKENFLIYFC